MAQDHESPNIELIYYYQGDNIHVVETDVAIDLINVYILSGVALMRLIPESAHAVDNLQNLSEGVYVLLVQTPRGSRVLKIIRQ